MEAQRQSVLGYLDGNGWEMMAEFIEVESGKRNDRLELAKALRECKSGPKATLIIAKLDRLARNVLVHSQGDGKRGGLCGRGTILTPTS